MLPGTQQELGRPHAGWRRRLHEIVFESETPAGRAFDVVLVAAILVSVAVVIADSVPDWHQRHGTAFTAAEWCFTLMFTVEYICLLYTSPSPRD